MKLTAVRIIEITLCLIMIAAVFMPFAYGITPFAYAFGWANYVGIILVSIPVSLLIPLLFVFFLKEKSLKTLRLVGMLLFLIVYGCYVYVLIVEVIHSYESYFLTLIFSLILLLVSLKFSKEKSDILINIIIAIIALPFVYHMPIFTFYYVEMDYGGWIIEGAFLSLYIIRLVSVFKRVN